MTDAVLTRAPGRSAVAPSAESLDHAGSDPHVERYLELFDSTEWGDEPVWLGAIRRGGISHFGQLGFPTTKNEDWHFTSPSRIAEREFAPAAVSPAALTMADIEPFLFPGEWHTLVFVNGQFVPSLSHVEAVGSDLYVGTLRSALSDDRRAAAIERHMNGLAANGEHAFTALNSAFMQDGAFISLPANAAAALPIHLLFVADVNAQGALMSPRNLVVLDHHAEATVVESYVTVGDASYLSNPVTELYIGAGAQLRHYKIQRESERAYHVGSSYAHQADSSHYESFSLATGADHSRTNIFTLLDGDGAFVTMNGLYMVDGEQIVDHQTRIEHIKEHTTSHELYKGVLDGHSHGVFNGKVYVQPEAQKTDGRQTNNNLLLSDRARVDTKPQLEIYADDVKCTHGATIGRLDDTALFYLKSRGIGTDTARRLLTYAFAAEVLEVLTVESVRDALESLAFERFAIAAEPAAEPVVEPAA